MLLKKQKLKKVISVSSRKVGRLMTKNVSKLKCRYNSRDNDSIFIEHFDRYDIMDPDTKDTQKNGALCIDLADKARVDRACGSLSTLKGNSILECNTFLQALFFVSFVAKVGVENLGSALRNKPTTKFMIRPMSTDVTNADFDYLKFEDFTETEMLHKKTYPDKIQPPLKKGDMVYVSNYDMYPQSENGAYAGEYCIVLNTKDKKNPLLYGFGIGSKKFSDVKETLKKSFYYEMKEVGIDIDKGVEKAIRKDRIAIDVVMRLKDYFN